jgi:ABC-2 type transport system ATP-binding protein
MNAGNFVGRVGGLAVALGIGVAAYGGSGIALADSASGSAGGDGNSGQSSSAPAQATRGVSKAAAGDTDSGSDPSAGIRRSRGGASVDNDAVIKQNDIPTPSSHSSALQAPVATPARPDPAPAASLPAPTAAVPVAPAAVAAPAAAVKPAAAVTVPAPPAAAEIVTGIAPAAQESAPVAAPAPAVSGVVTSVQNPALDPFAGLGGLLPTDSPLSWALMAFARRQPLAAASSSQPAAQVTASSIFDGNIAVDPKVVWGGLLGPDNAKTAMPGVLIGSVNAVSSEGLPMAYVGVGKPDAGGKIGGGPLLPLSNFYGSGGSFSYIPDAGTLTTPGAKETFKIMAMELSKFDQAIQKALGPAGALLVPQVLAIIHRIPLIGGLLSPIIGQAKIVEFTVEPNALAAGKPTAFTYMMPSFDGTPISLNYFPATNVAKGLADNAPTVLAASGLACAANTDPLTRYGQLFPAAQFGSLTPGIAPLRDDAFKSTLVGGPSYTGTAGGYNVVTWDPRGEFASGGELNIDNPMLEGRDVSSMITWLTSAANPAKAQVKTEADDPRIGVTGGSYGGGIQLTTVDPRIDAIAPEIAWNSLITSLYPDNIFKSGWGSILAAALAFTGARVNPAIYEGIFTGALFGFLSPSSQAVLASVGPTTLLTKEQAPTMLFQGIHDTLFPLAQSVANGQTIQTSPANPPLKLFWFCGGHGDCDIPNKPNEQDAQGVIQNLQWLDQYAAKAGNPADSIPTFQWYDEEGLYYNSQYLPWDPKFNDGGTFTATGKGGFLGIWPGPIGGSGPYPIKDLPFSIVNAGPAWNSIKVDFTPPTGKQIVGAPKLSFTYSGLGTSHAVFAQLVDSKTGLVLSNIVTPVPVTLDGKTRTASIAMEDIAFTGDPGQTLTLQITSSAINYLNAWTYGGINISDIKIDMPQHITVVPPPWTP